MPKTNYRTVEVQKESKRCKVIMCNGIQIIDLQPHFTDHHTMNSRTAPGMFQARYFYIQLHVLLAQRRSMKPEPRKTHLLRVGNEKHHRATCSCQDKSALSKMYTRIKMVQRSIKCIKRIRVAQTTKLIVLIHTFRIPCARVAIEMSWHLHLLSTKKSFASRR